MLLVIPIGSKELEISRVHLDDTLICTNQLIASIERRGHSDWDIYFGIRKICNKINIDLGRKFFCIRVIPSRTIRSIIPQITSMKSGTVIEFGKNSSDGIPPRNIGSFNLSDRGTSHFFYRSASWHGEARNEKYEGNIIFKNAGRENNF